MFLQKVRRTSTLGTSTQSYSNTNQTGNSPIVQVEPGADATKLDPTLTPTPNNPDTLTPPIQPAPTQPGLLLPVGGFFGTVYVVLTKPTPNAAVVVVEVTNDSMEYNKSIDKVMLDSTPDEPEDEELPPNVPRFDQERFDELINYVKGYVPEYIANGFGIHALEHIDVGTAKLTEDIAVILTPTIKRASYSYIDDNGDKQYLGAIYGAYGFSNVNIGVPTYLGTTATTELLFPLYLPTFVYDHAKQVTVQLGKEIRLQNEIYNTVGNTAITKSINANLFLGFYIKETETILSELGLLLKATITVKYTPAEHCHPVVEDLAIDAGSLNITEQYAIQVQIPDESIDPAEPIVPKRHVKRAYVNIGGKLVYLYSTKKETETTVFVNYDGSNYGVIVTTPDRTATIKTGKSKPTASFTNNINSYSLNTAQQALLQTCLPIPDDTLQGGFKVMASNGTTELNFKSYGFNSIFYRTPTVYNQTTIKGCAVYGL